MANSPNHVDGVDRRHKIFAHAAPGQLTIQSDVVDTTHHAPTRSGVADLCQRVEPGKDVGGMRVGFNQDDVRRRRVAESLDCGSDAAHLDFNVSLSKTPVFTRGLDSGRAFNRLAESLHRYAGRG